jgi:predicted metal-dependent enzyme (double-stranded beta helix superfamily)
MFDKEQFIADCRTALDGERDARNVREVVARAVANPAAVLRGLGEPKQSGIQTVHRSPVLTIINIVWPAGQAIMPHDHAMWAVIGIYTGQEENILWRRLPDDANGRIEAAGAKTLGKKDVLSLGPDAIHSVVNPLSRLTGAVHVYGGDFFGVLRSEWDPASLHEMPFDMEKVLRMFAAPA